MMVYMRGTKFYNKAWARDVISVFQTETRTKVLETKRRPEFLIGIARTGEAPQDHRVLMFAFRAKLAISARGRNLENISPRGNHLFLPLLSDLAASVPAGAEEASAITFISRVFF